MGVTKQIGGCGTEANHGYDANDADLCVLDSRHYVMGIGAYNSDNRDGYLLNPTGDPHDELGNSPGASGDCGDGQIPRSIHSSSITPRTDANGDVYDYDGD